MCFVPKSFLLLVIFCSLTLPTLFANSRRRPRRPSRSGVFGRWLSDEIRGAKKESPVPALGGSVLVMRGKQGDHVTMEGRDDFSSFFKCFPINRSFQACTGAFGRLLEMTCGSSTGETHWFCHRFWPTGPFCLHRAQRQARPDRSPRQVGDHAWHAVTQRMDQTERQTSSLRVMGPNPSLYKSKS